MMTMRLYYIDCDDGDIAKFMPIMQNLNIIRRGSGSLESKIYLLNTLKSYYVSAVLTNEPALLDQPAILDSTGKPDIYVYHNYGWTSVRKLPIETVNQLLAR